MSTLRGNLQSISLMDVVQLLNVNRKTGKLLVSHGKQSGVLYVLNGDVVHAETSQLLGELGAFEILEWDTGEFEFITTKFKAPNSIKRSVQDLLMEAARTSDTRRHLRTIFPDLQVVPWPTVPEPQLSAGIRMAPEDRKALPYLDGFRTFAEVMAVSGLSDVAVLQACAQVRDAGRLQVLDPSLSLTVQPMKAGLFKKGDHVELSRGLEVHWQMMPPYRDRALGFLRLLLPEGPAVEPVQFVKGLDEQSIGIPKELMQSWGLSEGMAVTVRPAP